MVTQDPIVYVVDDDEAVCKSLKWLFGTVDMPVRTYSSPQEFLASYQPGQPGCLLLDVRMPEMSGLELHRILVESRFDLPVIIITGHGDVQMAVRAMKAGAYDFVEKPFNKQVLLELVQKAVNESRKTLRRRSQKDEILLRLDLLTERERQVFDGIVAGDGNKVIAHQLQLSIKTVEVHRARLMKKMHAGSLVELMKMVAAMGADKGKP